MESKIISDSEFAADLMDLVTFLARTYGGNRPVFPEVDPISGETMEYSQRLERTWTLLFGPPKQPVLSHWEKCPTCGFMHIVRNDENDSD